MTYADRGGHHLERESDLLHHELPPAVARGLAEFLILVVLLAAAFTLFVKLPVSVMGRFVLKGTAGTDPVNAEAAGVVDLVAVQVGAPVKEGDTLLVIRSDDLRRLAAERLERLTALEQSRRELASMDGEGEASELQARVVHLEREVAAGNELRAQSAKQQDALLAESQADAARSAHVEEARADRVEALEALMHQRETLEKEGILSHSDTLERRGEFEDARAELEEARRERQRARGAIARIQSERLMAMTQQEEAMARLEGELAQARAARDTARVSAAAHASEAEEQVAALNRVLATVDGDRLTVAAPYDGVVVALDVERAGVSVERGQRLALVARGPTPLHASIQVPETEAARVVPGQAVRLMLDAYPYARHGIVEAKLTWVSPAPVDGKVPAIADLEEATVLVDGSPRALQAGLGGWARIDTGRNTVLQFVLEPLSQLRQRISSAEGSVPRPKPRFKPKSKPPATAPAPGEAPGAAPTTPPPG